VTDLAQILGNYEPRYRARFGNIKLPSQRRAVQAILSCRTEALGGHIYLCFGCGETQYSYHSCQNRHCPKCQNGDAQEWLTRQQSLLLPVPYFMLTFTLPSELRAIALANQRFIYNLLFTASASATQKLARDVRFVGGELGMIGVLHTWGRNLAYHPHVHFLVPAGGLSPDGESWLSAGHNFLLPIKALSRIFRAKFREALRQTGIGDDLSEEVWHRDWVVHCQPVGNGQAALRYLAPYIFRVAISNRRILKVANDRVMFQYTATETGKPRRCTLAAEDFIHRFLQHVLPRSFVKVRYYGFFSPGKRQQLQRVWQLLSAMDPQRPLPLPADSTSPAARRPGPTCPHCGDPLIKQQRIWPRRVWPQAP
jgi:hypothetical protein